jgi:hypothetical protein
MTHGRGEVRHRDGGGDRLRGDEKTTDPPADPCVTATQLQPVGTGVITGTSLPGSGIAQSGFAMQVSGVDVTNPDLTTRNVNEIFVSYDFGGGGARLTCNAGWPPFASGSRTIPFAQFCVADLLFFSGTLDGFSGTVAAGTVTIDSAVGGSGDFSIQLDIPKTTIALPGSSFTVDITTSGLGAQGVFAPSPCQHGTSGW